MKKELETPRRLFCWSGGGFPGIDIHLGTWLALEQRGITATAHRGTSAGAVIAAMAAAGRPATNIWEIVRALRDEDLRQERFCWKPRALWLTHFLELDPIAALLARLLPCEWRDLETELALTLTRARDGAPCEADRNGQIPLRKAVLASLAISGVFPHVEHGGEAYADGGARAYLPLPRALATLKNFDEVWLLIAARRSNYEGRDSILTRLFRTADWMMLDQVEDSIDRCREMRTCKVRAIWPSVRSPQGALRFDHDLIDRARLLVGAQIDGMLS